MLKIAVKHLKVFAILWLVIISVLFFLPGSALPKENWLDVIHFDKWVHIGFFALLLFLWRFYFRPGKKYHVIILVLALIYGLGVEAVQHYLVENRSFDLFDVIADMTGAITGILFWGGYIKK
jgi:VanZ family protein